MEIDRKNQSLIFKNIEYLFKSSTNSLITFSWNAQVADSTV